MAFWSEPPEADLRDIVARWCYSTDEGLALPWRVRVEPDARVDLIVAVDSVPASLGERPCRCDVFGIKTRPLEVATSHPRQTIAVQLRPNGLKRLFGLSAHELTDRSCDMQDIWSGRERDELRRLSGADSFGDRKRMIAAMLRRRLSQTPGPNDQDAIVSAAIAWIEQTRGDISITELTQRLDQHPRRLERLFLRHVGVGPKRYARLIRFDHAKQMIERHRPLVSVAAELGFCDQAHLCREFRALAGRTPSVTAS